MYQFEYTITDPIGIHARPAGQLAKEAGKYGCKVWLCKADKKAEVRRIMAVMGLGIKHGDTIRVEIEGGDEAQAGAQMEAFFHNNL